MAAAGGGGMTAGKLSTGMTAGKLSTGMTAGKLSTGRSGGGAFGALQRERALAFVSNGTVEFQKPYTEETREELHEQVQHIMITMSLRISERDVPMTYNLRETRTKMKLSISGPPHILQAIRMMLTPSGWTETSKLRISEEVLVRPMHRRTDEAEPPIAARNSAYNSRVRLSRPVNLGGWASTRKVIKPRVNTAKSKIAEQAAYNKAARLTRKLNDPFSKFETSSSE